MSNSVSIFVYIRCKCEIFATGNTWNYQWYDEYGCIIKTLTIDTFISLSATPTIAERSRWDVKPVMVRTRGDRLIVVSSSHRIIPLA